MRHGLLIFLALLAALLSGSFASPANEQIYVGDTLQNAFAQGWDAGGRRNSLQVATYQYNARGKLTSEPVGVNSRTLATNNYTFDSGLLGVRVGSQESGGLTNGWTGQLNPLAQVASEAWNESSLTLRACGRVGKGGSAAASLDGNAVDATMSWSLINDRWYSDLTLTPGSHSLAVSAYYPAGQFTATVTNAFTVLSTNNVADAFDGAGYVTNRVFASGKTQALTWDAAGRLVGLVQWNNASNGFFWTAIYDALGRRLRTSYVSVINGYTNTLLASTVDAYFDPQVEFEEVGVALNGQRTWKVLGPDLDGHYGSLQGVGGLEATVRESDHNTTPVLNDYCGNVLATVSGPVVFWNPVRVGGYGPVAGYQASPLLGSTPLADTLVWRSRGIDPSGFYNLGARYYDPVAGHFLSPDPLGHAASLDLYSFCGGDPLNRFDPTGRFAKGNFEQGYQTLQSAGRAFGEGARQFDMAHEDEIQQTLMEVDGAAVCFALPVLAEGLLGEGMGAGAGMALEEGEIGGVEGFNLRSASWAARLEGSEGVGLAEVGTSESKIAGSAASTIVENTGAVEAEAASMAETGAAKESGALANGGRASRSLDLEDSSAVDHEARNAAADAEWETQNPASTPLLLKAPNRTRFSRDVAVNPTAPAPLPLNRAIGGTPAQQQALTTDIQYARSLKATDIRVNQQQVNATGQRVGVNRPDLQYSLPNGTRVYIEYDNTTPATWPNTPRGPGHGIRILSNDPNGVYIQRSF